MTGTSTAADAVTVLAEALDRLGARIHRDLHPESSYRSGADPVLAATLDGFSTFAEECLAALDDPAVVAALAPDQRPAAGAGEHVEVRVTGRQDAVDVVLRRLQTGGPEITGGRGRGPYDRDGDRVAFYSHLQVVVPPATGPARRPATRKGPTR